MLIKKRNCDRIYLQNLAKLRGDNNNNNHHSFNLGYAKNSGQLMISSSFRGQLHTRIDKA